MGVGSEGLPEGGELAGGGPGGGKVIPRLPEGEETVAGDVVGRGSGVPRSPGGEVGRAGERAAPKAVS